MGANQSHPAISAHALEKRYRMGEREVHALRSASLSVEQGSVTALSGPSGSGKSTLLHLLGLLDTPDSGTITFGKTAVAELTPAEAARFRRDNIGFVFQDFNLIPVLSAFENVELPLRAASGRVPSPAHEWVLHLLEVLGLADQHTHRPSQLSGGQQQRVAIARALVRKPAVVLADEPTANLDSQTGADVLDYMARINTETGTTFVVASHDQAVRDLAHHTVTIRDGRIEP